MRIRFHTNLDEAKNDVGRIGASGVGVVEDGWFGGRVPCIGERVILPLTPDNQRDTYDLEVVGVGIRHDYVIRARRAAHPSRSWVEHQDVVRMADQAKAGRLMLGLTLHRPWSWAMFNGKPVENRKQKPWAKIIGTRIALHAGETYDYEGAEFIKRVLGVTTIPHAEPGMIVGTVLVAGWIAKGTKANVKFASEVIASAPELLELASSEWFFGPYGWVMREPIALPKQVRARGMQGLWLLPDHVEAEVRRQEDVARAA